MGIKQKQLNKNYNMVDICKFIGSILVVFIHYGSVVDNEWYILFFINEFCQYAVPFFFAATGFFFFKKIEFQNGKIKPGKDNIKKFLNYEKRIIILYLVWTVIYTAYKIYKYYIFSLGDFEFWKNLIIACITDRSYYHLWYLLSIIFAIPVLYLLLRFIGINATIIISVPLYLLGILGYTYKWLTFPAPFPDFPLIFNTIKTFGLGLCRALPLIVLGLICVIYHNKRSGASIIWLLIFLIMNVTELLFLYNLHTPNPDYSYIITTLPLTYFLFVCISDVNINVNKTLCLYLRRMSTIIYCSHPLIFLYMDLLAIENKVFSFVFYLIICILFSFIIVCLSDLKYLRWLKYLE